MKSSAKLISALVIAAASAFALPAQAAWSSQLTQPYFGHNAVLLNGLSPAMLQGRQVIGMNGHRLGTVTGVDRITGSVRIRTVQGGRITVPKRSLRRFGGNLLALNTARLTLAQR